MSDQDLFNEAYKDNNYQMLVFETDGESVKLKLKTKKVPGLGEMGTVWAKRKSNGSYVFNAGLGEEEYDANDVPNPIRKLIDSKGGGPGGNAVSTPPLKAVLNDEFFVRPYMDYRANWYIRHGAGAKDALLTESEFRFYGNEYQKITAPLYL